MKVFITGGAGFIGSHLVGALLEKKASVIVYDNLSGGREGFLQPYSENSKFSFIKGDVLNKKNLRDALPRDTDIVFHFAANANVRKGIEQTDLDLNQGILATYNVLESMREKKIEKIVFPSSMTVYGNSVGKPFTEQFGPCLPISLYAASKLGAEGLISGYVSAFDMQAWIFRFANVIGPNLTHGVIFDLINKLKNDPNKLPVLGDGTQAKPYIFVDDVINAMLHVILKEKEQINLFNVGTSGSTSVKQIVAEICKQMSIRPKVLYEKQQAGWKGDVTECAMNISKLKSTGFLPIYSSKQAIKQTVSALLSSNG